LAILGIAISFRTLAKVAFWDSLCIFVIAMPSTIARNQNEICALYNMAEQWFLNGSGGDRLARLTQTELAPT
jgi:hypothetical protein